MEQQIKSASGKAIAALVLGILSVLCMGFMTGVPAIIIGMTELAAIKNGKSPSSGAGMAKTGYLLGIIGTAVSVAAFFVGLLFFLLGISLGAVSYFHSLIRV